MNKNKKIIIIVAIVVICSAIVLAAYNFGFIHNGSFAKEGTVYGPGKYVIGKDLPPGFYSMKGNITVKWKNPTRYVTQENNVNRLFGSVYGKQLNFAAENALKNGTIVIVHDSGSVPGSLKYDGPISSHNKNIDDIDQTKLN